MSKTYAFALSFVLAIALVVMTGLAIDAAVHGWGLKCQAYIPLHTQGQKQTMVDF